MMHIETLRVFCDVVETGSFSAAASQNYITQSAVSQQLRGLESRYQCALLERSRHGAKPTAAGEILYRVSREILEKYEEIETQLQETGKTVAGNLRVAIVYSLGLHELPPYLKEYMRNYPQVNVHVEYSRPNKIYDSVIAGQIDLGIVAYPQKHPQVQNVPWREDRLVLACHPEHLFAGLKKVNIAKLTGESLVGYEHDIPTRKATDQLLREHQVTARYAAEFDNIETIKRSIEIGQGIGIVPLAAIQPELELGTLKAVQITEANLLRPLGIIHKKGRHLSPAAVKFIEILQREDLR